MPFKKLSSLLERVTSMLELALFILDRVNEYLREPRNIFFKRN